MWYIKENVVKLNEIIGDWLSTSWSVQNHYSRITMLRVFLLIDKKICRIKIWVTVLYNLILKFVKNHVKSKYWVTALYNRILINFSPLLCDFKRMQLHFYTDKSQMDTRLRNDGKKPMFLRSFSSNSAAANLCGSYILERNYFDPRGNRE